MAGDHPDPSILKDGDDYYMTFSSFDAYPGLVIWHSRDLVNWQPIGPALFKNVGSVWAPDLVKHKGRYYIYFPGISPNRSNYVIWADDIRGPWSAPIDLKLTRIDPGHAVGPDGKRYLFLSAGELVQLADDGLSTVGAPKKIYDGWKYPGRLDRRRLRAGRSEDPASAATTTTWCWPRAGRPGRRPVTWSCAARSKTIEGPWENSPYNPILRTQVERRALVVEGSRHARRRSRRQVVDGLSRLRERLLHARPADAARADRVDGRWMVPRRAERIRRRRSRSRRASRARMASPSPMISRSRGWACSGASTPATRPIAIVIATRTARWS